MATSFVPLRLRSRYTRAGGTMPAAGLGQRLAEYGFGAGALRDRGNLYGAVEFYESCIAAGVKPIIGVDLTCPVSGDEIGLVALNRDGYTSLCEVTSRDAGLALTDAIGASPRGLGIICRRVETALALAERVGREAIWVEVVANLEAAGAIRTKLAAAEAAGLRALASWEVLNLEAAEDQVSLVLMAIDQGKTVEQVGARARDASLAACGSVQAAFHGEPGALAESMRLSEMVDLNLDLGRPHFPRIEGSPGVSAAGLQALCLKALPARYPRGRDAARARLDHELATIETLGFTDYFLVVGDIVNFAVGQGIPVSGRGSGAASIVAYLLGITQVDPVAEDLIFERFLTEMRPDYPDIDIDISWRRRDEVISYVYRRFGDANVAMISTRASFETRLAAREVAKAFGLSPYEAQALADRLPYHGSADTAGAIRNALGTIKPEIGRPHRDAIARLAGSIMGFPNHSSVHCGGIVVSDRPITCYTPLETAAKGIRVTQFDMRSIERVGLIKIDLLGNRVLSVIEEATRDVGRVRGLAPEIPPDDPPTARLLSRGETLGCFQLESPAMRNLLKMIKARTRSDATLALALVRPGPAAGGMKQEFARRRAAARPGNPARAGDNSGLPVYEEDVMRLIVEHTGIGLGDAEVLRRALKHEGSDSPALAEKFLYLAETWGTDRTTALRAWNHIRRFASYTFSKAHAASFGTLAYTAAYLKAHFPLEFYAAALRNHSGMYPLWVHVNEARRLGLRVLPPAINRSEGDFAIEDGCIRTGLGSVKHLASATIAAATAERRRAPFTSLADFLARVRCGRDETLALVAGGAFDEVAPSRCEALAGYLAARGKPVANPSLALAFPDEPRGLPTQPFAALELRRMEYETLDFSPLVHPLEFFEQPRGAFAGPGTARTVRGLAAALRHYRAKGPGLWFVSLDAPDGIHEVIVPEGAPRDRLEIGAAYIAEGTLDHRVGIATLRARSIRRLAARSQQQLRRPPRIAKVLDSA